MLGHFERSLHLNVSTTFRRHCPDGSRWFSISLPIQSGSKHHPWTSVEVQQLTALLPMQGSRSGQGAKTPHSLGPLSPPAHVLWSSGATTREKPTGHKEGPAGLSKRAPRAAAETQRGQRR